MGNKIDIQRLPQAEWKRNENLEAKLSKTVSSWSKRTNSQEFSFWSHARAAAIDPPGVSERRKPLPDWLALGFCALTSLNTFKVSQPSKAHRVAPCSFPRDVRAQKIERNIGECLLSLKELTKELIRGKLPVLVIQSCPTLCDPMDYSPPASSLHGIFQARILGWVAISSHICLING